MADDYFDPELLNTAATQNKHIDLSIFSKQGGQAAGSYVTNVYVNNNYISNEEIRYDHLNKDDSVLYPIFTKNDYIKIGVAPNATSAFMKIPNDQVINDISQIIPDAFVKYNFSQSRLDISIPQQYTEHSAQGFVSESQWDEGITALFTNYTYTGASTKFDGQSGVKQSSYLNLRSGLNWEAWRLRNYSTYSHSNHTDKWKSINTYLQRDIKPLKGQLVIGDSTSPSDMFDSFSFRGIQLSSDDAMQPSSLRGFAPMVRGIAKTNAQVTIRQNGNIIWQSYVPPGPFMINDLYPTSASGDLEVTVKESNGSTLTFMQAFSSVPIMLREGRFKYSFTAGEYRATGEHTKKPTFVQATGIYGLPYTSTVYGGAIISERYNSLLFGVGKSLGDIGSISFDATIANAKIEDENNTGGSFRFQYSKESLSTGTSFSLAGYRYSTSKYRDFAESNGYYDSNYSYNSNTLDDDTFRKNYGAWRNRQTKRDKLQININQTLGDFGNIYVSAYQQQYWNVKGKERNLNLGYNKNYNGINYSFNYSYTKDLYTNRNEQNFSLSVQIPFDFVRSNTWLNLAANTDDRGNNTSSIGISGNALSDNSLSYNVQEGYTNRGTGSTGTASATYKASFGEYQLGYNYTRYSQQANYSATGSIVVHPYGVSFGQSLGESSALIMAKGAKDVRVLNNIGVYTDRWGGALVPYTTPYERNVLSLDTTKLDKRVDLLNSTKIVVPTRGAIVLADYQTQIGYKVFMTITGADIPFGAKASIQNGTNVSTGIVDDGQKVFLSGAPSEGVVNITWNDGQCNVPYKLADSSANIILLSAPCNQ